MTRPVEVRRVRLGVVLLCHARLDVAAHMARIWVQGGARVAIHVDAKASARSVARMQVELSDLAPDEILVRVVACGICHTDMAVRDAQLPVPLPAVLGHEGAGIVEAVGSGARRVVTMLGSMTYATAHGSWTGGASKPCTSR